METIRPPHYLEQQPNYREQNVEIRKKNLELREEILKRRSTDVELREKVYQQQLRPKAWKVVRSKVKAMAGWPEGREMTSFTSTIFNILKASFIVIYAAALLGLACHGAFIVVVYDKTEHLWLFVLAMAGCYGFYDFWKARERYWNDVGSNWNVRPEVLLDQAEERAIASRERELAEHAV
ncbi:unnamed protein product [Caenorhabditis auriculariae]|uniref:Uncharacterized protein n=1 Tax=Caenorhabditis auriculariae TaxID=2777116 RepID=A0A8S1HM19_9PELO|nr:unnamed protein product [Caenorhabditis auriculariae]